MKDPAYNSNVEEASRRSRGGAASVECAMSRGGARGAATPAQRGYIIALYKR